MSLFNNNPLSYFLFSAQAAVVASIASFLVILLTFGSPA
jgi:hypothetical protein